MNIKYDKVANAVYMRFVDGTVASSFKLDDTTYVDRDSNGNTIGLEILDASSRPELISGLEDNVQNGVGIDIVQSTPIIAA